ncbi:MAG: T9SS type A sorting domain-containing protein [Prolixibacteraceae bacterium]
MKKLIIYFILLFAAFEIEAQTLIATSNLFEATANHNQRKIVRDSLYNVYIVYVDSTDQGKIIKGLWLNNQTNNWSSTTEITAGTNPSLSINKFGRFNLLFESNDTVKMILQSSSTDFINWTTTQKISDPDYYCQLPICDSDSSGNFNVFWIKNTDNSKQSLMYASILDNEIIAKKLITTKSKISDVAIANHLQNNDDDLIFSFQFDEDSLQFFSSKNKLETIDTLYKAIGTQPCISYNAMIPYYYSSYNENPIRILYLDNSKQLIEVECGLDYYSQDNLPKKIMESDPIDYICIDDVLPPIGYSYLFMKDDTLYHGFSYGAEWQWSTILDTISTNPLNPSLAYKNFNSLFVDFIWMQKNNSGYNIYYKRDDKQKYIHNSVTEFEKGFSIIGYPNPFKEKLEIEISVENGADNPLIEIYDSNAKKIKILQAINISSNKYYYQWNANNFIPSGVYFIKCSVGQNTTVRKVIYNK